MAEFALIFSFSLITFFLLATTLLIVTILIIHLLLRPKLWCNCKICQTYLTSSWSNQFVNLCDWYSHLLANSPTKTIHIHVLGNTITSNPENVEYMLKTRFENFPKGKPFSAILGDFLGQGIFNVDGELWRFQRKMASLELDRYSIKSFAFGIVKSEIQKRLIPLLLLNKGAVLDLQSVFRQFSFDTICRFSFGLDPVRLEAISSVPMSDFAFSFDLASKLSAERAMTASPLIWRVKRLLNLGSEKRLKEAIYVIDSLAQGVIKQKRKMGFSSHKDLLSRFMRTVNDDETFLRDIIVSFLLAGRDTVASALTSFFWLMAENPNAQLAIRVEADRILGSGKDFKSFEQMQELHYLQAAIYESMRLYPPIQFDSKFCVEDDVLPDGTFVKRGTRVTYHPYAMGRTEEIWGSDCSEFKPERWLKDGVFLPQNPFKYPVFQAGLRVCLGKEMAMVELKSVALSLLRRFEIELAAPPQYRTPRFSPGLTATFSGGLPVLMKETETLISSKY